MMAVGKGGEMNISYVEPLGRAWGRMKQLLFNPFDLGAWLVLAFSAWLAGLMDGGGPGGMSHIGNLKDNGEAREMLKGAGHLWDAIAERMVWLPLILFVIVLVVALVLTLLWLSSRAKFIYLDNLANSRARIVEPWGRLKHLGDSLFLWRLLFGLVVTLAIGAGLWLLFLSGALAALSPGRSFRGTSIALVILLGVLGFVFVVAVAYVGFFLENFVVPIMYRFNMKCSEAWHYFLPWLSQNPWHFIFSGLFVLVLFIGVGTLIFVAGLLTCCVALLILAIPYVGTAILLPLLVTYRAFGPEFLAQFDPGFNIFPVDESTVEAASPDE
jgi:hypothetical protein